MDELHGQKKLKVLKIIFHMTDIWRSILVDEVMCTVLCS